MRAVSESKRRSRAFRPAVTSALVEAERKVIVVVGHPETRTRLLEGDRPDNERRAEPVAAPRLGLPVIIQLSVKSAGRVATRAPESANDHSGVIERVIEMGGDSPEVDAANAGNGD